MTRWRTIGARIGALATLVASAAVAGPSTLTLEDVVARAMAVAPAVRVAAARVETAVAGVGVAEATRLPSLGLTLAGTAFAAEGSLWGAGVASVASEQQVLQAMATANLGWRAYDFGATGHAVAAARLGVQESEAESEADRDDLAAYAASVFLALTTAEDEGDVLRDAAGITERIKVLTAAQVARGLRSPLDERRAVVDVERARALVDDASRRAEALRAELRPLLGESSAPEWRLRRPDRLTAPGPRQREAWALAAARLRADRLDEEGRAESSRRLPVVSLRVALSAEANRAASSGASDGVPLRLGQATFAAAGVVVEVPLWEPTSNARASLARQRADQARVEVAERERSFRVALARSEAELARAQRAEEASRLWGEASRDVLTQSLDRYEHGLLSPLEVAHARMDHTAARLAALDARAKADAAWVTLVRLLGTR